MRLEEAGQEHQRYSAYPITKASCDYHSIRCLPVPAKRQPETDSSGAPKANEDSKAYYL